MGNTFNAALAGLGVHTITYTVAGSSGCVGTGNVNITVNDCIERHNKFAGAVRIYPNPNNGKFRIRFLSDLYKEFNVRIVDAIGQPVSGDYKFSAVRHGDEFEINVPNLPSGYYMLMVYNAQERAAFKFEIIR